MSAEANLFSDRAEPFLVLGHHTNKLYQIVALGRSIGEMIDIIEARAKKSENGIVPDYYMDVFGETTDSRAKVITNLRHYFETFLTLPDEHPVQFIPNGLDGICNSCAIGKHCDKNIENRSESFNVLAINAVAESVETLGLDELSIKDSNGSITVPAWIARAVVGDLEFYLNCFPERFKTLATKSILRMIDRMD